MQKAISLAVVIFLMALVSHAQEAPRGDVSAGYSFLRFGTTGNTNEQGGSFSPRNTAVVSNGAREHDLDVDDRLLIPEGTTVTLLLTRELKGGKKYRGVQLVDREGNESSKKVTPSIVVVQDVVVDGTTVIKGTAAQFMFAEEAPGLLRAPGRVTLEVVSVPSTSLDSVPLSASQSARGEEPSACLESGGCVAFLLAFFWLRGDPGKLNNGLLFNAYVTEDTQVNRGAQPLPAVSDSLPARLHLYQVMPVTSRRSAGIELGNQADDLSVGTIWSTFSLDGRRVGTLEGLQYACVKVSPGNHTLRVERHEYTFDISAHQELYVRVMSQGRDRLVESTDGYQLGAATLEPGRFKRDISAPCFELPDNIAGLQSDPR